MCILIDYIMLPIQYINIMYDIFTAFTYKHHILCNNLCNCQNYIKYTCIYKCVY